MFHAFVVVCAQSEEKENIAVQLENFCWCGKCSITTCKARNSMNLNFTKVKKKNIMRVNETEHEGESFFFFFFVVV